MAKAVTKPAEKKAEKRSSKAGVQPGQSLHRGVSRAPNLQRKATRIECTIAGCTREYFSPQGLRYHLEAHHTEAERRSGRLAAAAAAAKTVAEAENKDDEEDEEDDDEEDEQDDEDGEKADAEDTILQPRRRKPKDTEGKGKIKSESHKRDTESDNLALASRKKARLLEEDTDPDDAMNIHIPHIPAVAELPFAETAKQCICGNTEDEQLLEDHKRDLVGLMKQVASKVSADETSLLLRVEHLQKKTNEIVEEMSVLSKRKSELIQRTQKYQGEFPQYLAQLLKDGIFNVSGPGPMGFCMCMGYMGYKIPCLPHIQPQYACCASQKHRQDIGREYFCTRAHRSLWTMC